MKDDLGLPLENNGKTTAPSREQSNGNPTGVGRLLNRWRIPLLIVLLFVCVAIGMRFSDQILSVFDGVTDEQSGEVTDETSVAQPEQTPPLKTETVHALGRLMPQGDVVRLAVPFGASDAVVARLLVEEGEDVEAGQLIAELDSLEQYRADLAAAQANVDEKEAALGLARINVEADLAEAQASRDRAASAWELADTEAKRHKSLFQRGVATKVALDRAQSAAVQAARELDKAGIQLTRLEGGDNQPSVALALRQLDVARTEFARARVTLAQGQVLAPQAGRILKLHVRAGEKPDTSGIATLGAIDQMEAELEVYQTDIAHIALGQTVILASPALTKPLTGIVNGIGLEVERQTVVGSDPAANTDARIVRVTVSLDPASSIRASTLTGLEVTGRVVLSPPKMANSQ